MKAENSGNTCLNTRKINAFFILFFIIFVNISSHEVFAKELVLEGIYRGENLYVKNPYAASGVGFCVSEITVNERTSTDEINSSFFEIDLSVYGFHFGTALKIIIKYKDNCPPQVVNPEVLTPNSTFEIKSISIDKKGYINWTTIKEHGKLPFIIEQYKWNKWVRAGAVKGKGLAKETKYRYGIDFNTGKNKFRVKQVGYKGKVKYSESVVYMNDVDEISFIPGNGNKAGDKLFFSGETHFEIFDYYGKLIKSGIEIEVDISTLKKGTYFLNYDNKTATFIKK